MNVMPYHIGALERAITRLEGEMSRMTQADPTCYDIMFPEGDRDSIKEVIAILGSVSELESARHNWERAAAEWRERSESQDREIAELKDRVEYLDAYIESQKDTINEMAEYMLELKREQEHNRKVITQLEDYACRLETEAAELKRRLARWESAPVVATYDGVSYAHIDVPAGTKLYARPVPAAVPDGCYLTTDEFVRVIEVLVGDDTADGYPDKYIAVVKMLDGKDPRTTAAAQESKP